MYQEHHLCRHLPPASFVSTILNSLETKEKWNCSDCTSGGPHLWICLHPNCFYIGCSEKKNDHSTKHNESLPSHCVHMNLGSKRCWCYECRSEVVLDAHPISLSEQNYDMDSDVGASGRWPLSTQLRFQSSGDQGDYSEDGSEDTDGNSKPYGLVGLQNIGNTCYMNAALQALSNAAPLTNYFLDCSAVVHLLTKGKSPALSKTYQTLIRDIWLRRTCGYVSPSGILYGIRAIYPMYRGYCQHDTQEFLRNFMDQLHEELKQAVTAEGALTIDTDAFSIAPDSPTINSSYDSSEGEYETCDSGVSERSSLSDDTERTSNTGSPTNKRRHSRSSSPGRRMRMKFNTKSNIIDSQPSPSSSLLGTGDVTAKKQIKYRSIISDIFDGKLLSSVQCLTCDRISSRIETFQDLSLPIPSRDHLILLHGRNNIIPGAKCSNSVLSNGDSWLWWILSWFRSWFYGPTVTLHDCLAAFFSTDELKGDNMYSCEKCNKLRNGIKFSKVLQLPEVLCIHLKRFRHELMFSSKISAFVSFPLRGLDMQLYLHSECISKVTLYELFAVICHYGTGGGGHYICYALNGDQWYEFDDQYVTLVGSEKVQSSEAYVLFYRKVSDNADEVRERAAKMATAADSNSNQIGALLSKQWLNRFHTCTEPGPIDNSDFLCVHNNVNPEREQMLNELAVVIPQNVYEYLHKLFGGYPILSSAQPCSTCQAANSKRVQELTAFYNLDVDSAHLKTHLICAKWFELWQHFLLKRINEPPSSIDNSTINISDDITFVAITDGLWKFLVNVYGGGPESHLGADMESHSSSEPSEDEVQFVKPPTLRKHQQVPGTINKELYSAVGEGPHTTNTRQKEDIKNGWEGSKGDSGEGNINDESCKMINGDAETACIKKTWRRRKTSVSTT